MKVAVIMGSKSDYPKLEDGIELLREVWDRSCSKSIIST